MCGGGRKVDGNTIPFGIMSRVQSIARDFPAVLFDAFDPHRAAIEAACATVGVVAIPSEAVQPRSILGSINTPDPDARDVAVLAAVLHEHLCLPGGVPIGLCEADLPLAKAMVDELDLRGWRLARQPFVGGRAQARP